MDALHSEEAWLAFLRKIYVPGNTDVADRILAMKEDSSVIEKELAHAEQSGDLDRAREMAIQYIDYCVRNNFTSFLRNKVIKWNNSELADYAIEQMTSEFEEERRSEQVLECAAEIAQAFGKQDIATQNLERLLAFQEKDTEHKYRAGTTLKKLGRFGEAIDVYLEEGAPWELKSALDLAREHCPNRITEVAQRGFNTFDTKRGFWEFYVECAEILDKKNKAERTAVKYARRTKIDDPPRCYEGIVNCLVKFGQDDEAKKLVSRIVRHEEYVRKGEGYYEFDRPKELAVLHHAVGETAAIRKIYAERIDKRLREGHHPSNTQDDIKKAIELTGDQSFREKELDLLERERDYQKAAALATEIGKPELAQIYSTMYEMIPKQE